MKRVILGKKELRDLVHRASLQLTLASRMIEYGKTNEAFEKFRQAEELLNRAGEIFEKERKA